MGGGGGGGGRLGYSIHVSVKPRNIEKIESLLEGVIT